MPNRSHAGIVGPFAPGGAGVRGGCAEGGGARYPPDPRRGRQAARNRRNG